MAILTSSDRNLYFPGLPIGGTILDAALQRAQMTAESALGCNRSLEVTEYTEILTLGRTLQECQLHYLPVLEDPLPIFYGRSKGQRDGWGRVTRVSDWILLDPATYRIDYETGKVYFETTLMTFGFSTLSQVKAVYSAGYDFTSNSDPTVRQIKTAVANILLYQVLG